MRHANGVDSYGKYCGAVSQLTTVDIGACVQAYGSLIQSSELRRKNGRCRRGRAGPDRIRLEPCRQKVSGPVGATWPTAGAKTSKPLRRRPENRGYRCGLTPLPFSRNTPPAGIGDDTPVALYAGSQQGWLGHICSSVMNTFVMTDGTTLLPKEELATIIQYLATHEKSTGRRYCQAVPGAKRSDCQPHPRVDGQNRDRPICKCLTAPDFARKNATTPPVSQPRTEWRSGLTVFRRFFLWPGPGVIVTLYYNKTQKKICAVNPKEAGDDHESTGTDRRIARRICLENRTSYRRLLEEYP